MCLPPTLLGKALSPGSHASAATPALPSPFVLQSPHLQGDKTIHCCPLSWAGVLLASLLHMDGWNSAAI